LSGINEEVTINDRRKDDSECLVFQAADMNNDLVFPGIWRGAVNEEVMLYNWRNGGDDFAASQDTEKNNEQMHSETSNRE